jgi:Transcription factor WhiB
VTVDWRQHAACRGTDSHLWDTPPHKPGPDRDHLIATARQAFTICSRCTVQAACAADAGQQQVIGVIRAGIAYDSDGTPSRACGHCGWQIVARNGTLAKYCSSNCANLAAYHAARTERVAA